MPRLYRILWIIGFLIVLFLTIGVLTYRNIQSNLDNLKDETVLLPDLRTLKDGTYPGSFKVFPISVELEVTLKNHSLSDIVILKHENRRGQPAEAILGEVLRNQTLEVDTVTGATYSSKVILKAIAQALAPH